jgi:hypothetical protein
MLNTLKGCDYSAPQREGSVSTDKLRDVNLGHSRQQLHGREIPP